MKSGLADRLKRVRIGLAVGVALLIGVIIASVYLIRVMGDTPSLIPASVNIAGTIYSSEQRMKVLEIVPDEAYDELGPLMGNDQGTMQWKDIVDGFPKGAGRDSEISDYTNQVLNHYCGFVSATTGNKYKLGFKDKQEHFYGQPWEINWAEISYDLSNLTPVLCFPDNNLVEQGTIRNYFAYAIFGSNAMEDKMELQVKKASDVTEEDIASAGLVYLNGKSHDTELIHAYNDRYDKNVNDNMNRSNSNCDLNARTAFYLYRDNVIHGKALIFQSEDKNPGPTGKYSNIARMSLLLCGIDGDTFISEFAAEETDWGFKGTRGSVHFVGDTFEVYLNTESGEREMKFSSSMFIDSSNGYVSEDRNNQSAYPAYNASALGRQYLVSRNAFEYNSDNSMTMDLLTKDLKQPDYDSEGRYLGTTYEDATKKTGDESLQLTPARAIRYILGDFVQTTVKELHILEVEPTGVEHFNQDNRDDKQKICSWFGLTTDEQTAVTIDHASVNALDGMNVDLCAEYDLIILGTYDGGVVKTDQFGELYHRRGNVTSGDASLGSNDLNETVRQQLVSFALSGLPIVMDQEIYYCDHRVVADDTYMKSMCVTQLTEELLQYKVITTNIVTLPESGHGRRLQYKEKPDSDIHPEAQIYDGYHATVTAGNLPSMKFSGSVSSESYRVKIYIDKNCDSLYAEDCMSDDAELVYFASSGSGPSYDSRGKIQGVLHSGAFDETLQLPQTLTGYIGWKVEVEDEKTGLIHVQTGAFAIVPGNSNRKVKVLQIRSDTAESAIRLDGDTFQNCFYAKSGVTGLGLSVTVYTKSEFNQVIQDHPGILNGYSILVMGLADSYGVTSYGHDLSKESLDAIDAYIKGGNSVLFTHDCMSYKDGRDVAGSESNLNDYTRRFKDEIGMQSGYSLTNSLILKLTGKTVYQTVDGSGYTRNTTTVKKLNDGEITSYPYALAGQSIHVQETHGQFFQLNLDQQEDSDKVVVWYTLAEDASYPESNYFSYTGQDAQNNYYIYSKGNITYTSAGHKRIDVAGNETELQLFVNTFVRAILSGNSIPQVEFNDAAMEDENLYTLTIRNRLDDKIDRLPIRFTVSDADLVAGVGKLKQSCLFYDRNCSGEYEEGQDQVIGYLDSEGNASNEPYGDYWGVISGKTYTIDLLNMVSGSGMSSDLKQEIKEKLLTNQLQIGVLALDGNDTKGYATAKIVQRELFLLN